MGWVGYIAKYEFAAEVLGTDKSHVRVAQPCAIKQLCSYPLSSADEELEIIRTQLEAERKASTGKRL